MRVNSPVICSGKDRQYNECLPSRNAVALGELYRRHNDNEIPLESYPVMWGTQKLFEAPKSERRRNSWMYDIEYRLSRESVCRKVTLEGVSQQHMTGAFLVWICQAMHLGQIPKDRFYEISDIRRNMHRVTIQPNDP